MQQPGRRQRDRVNTALPSIAIAPRALELTGRYSTANEAVARGRESPRSAAQRIEVARPRSPSGPITRSTVIAVSARSYDTSSAAPDSTVSRAASRSSPAGQVAPNRD